MTRFPVEIAQMPELVSVNISNNAQWSAEELYKGLDAIANGPSKEKLQILYATNNKLREIPESFSNLKKIGLLDLSRNQIETLHPLGKEVAPEQLYLDHNNITSCLLYTSSSTSTRTTPISIPTMSPARPPWISTTMPTCAIRATSTRPRPVMPTG